MNDAELVQRLLASEGQDQAVAEALVRGQMDRIARLCRSMVRNEQAAAELAQEALVRLYTSIPRFRGECKWSTWSHRIARNLCLNWLEKMREKVGDEGLHLVDDGPDAIALQSSVEREQGVQRSIHAVLDPQEAEAVRLHYTVGLSIAEVTEVMELQMRTGARGLLQRARRKLKKHMMAHMLEDSIVQRAVPPELTAAMESTLVQLTRGTHRDLPGLEPSLRDMTSAEEDWLS
jgi:RNA polymerase sigma-70 factor (ECF subfamily)